MAVLAVAGCSSSPTASASPSASPSPTASPVAQATPPSDETPVPHQVLPPATDGPVANLCAKAVTSTADGNVTPLQCSSGALNVNAWRYYADISASVLGLGLNPTAGQATNAMCDDLAHNHATRAQEPSGYALAKAYYGWSFDLDPTKLSC